MLGGFFLLGFFCADGWFSWEVAGFWNFGRGDSVLVFMVWKDEVLRGLAPELIGLWRCGFGGKRMELGGDQKQLCGYQGCR